MPVVVTEQSNIASPLDFSKIRRMLIGVAREVLKTVKNDR